MARVATGNNAHVFVGAFMPYASGPRDFLFQSGSMTCAVTDCEGIKSGSLNGMCAIRYNDDGELMSIQRVDGDPKCFLWKMKDHL